MTNRRWLASLALLALAACSSRTVPEATTTPPASSTAPIPTIVTTPSPSGQHAPGSRVAVIVMENKEYDSVAGKPDAPYTNRLADTSALATSYYAVSHPSLPNYLAMIGGDTYGITSDCTDCHTGARNLVDSLEAAGVSWKAYMEGMPRACFTGSSSGRYAKKHNPFVYFDDVVSNGARCANVVPLSDMNAAALPDFVWVTPDICNDTHDCSVATGDRFLSRMVPRLLRGLGPRGIVFVTYDEGGSDAHGGGHVLTIATGPGARPGRYAQTFDHYSLLRTIEDVFGLHPIGRSTSAPDMGSLLRPAR